MQVVTSYAMKTEGGYLTTVKDETNLKLKSTLKFFGETGNKRRLQRHKDKKKETIEAKI